MSKNELKLWMVSIADYHDEPSVYLIASHTKKKAEKAAIKEHRGMFPEVKRSELTVLNQTICIDKVPLAYGGECNVYLEPVPVGKSNPYKGNPLYEAYLREIKIIAECDEIDLTEEHAEQVAVLVTQSDSLAICLNNTIRDYIKTARVN